MDDKGGQSIEERGVVALERIAVANEELIRLATEEREIGELIEEPPFCPHCGRLNPVIRNEGGSGEFGEFILVARCEHCSHTFLAVPVKGWNVYRNQAEYEGRLA